MSSFIKLSEFERKEVIDSFPKIVAINEKIANKVREQIKKKLDTQLKDKIETSSKTYGSINYDIQEIGIDENVKYISFSPNLFVYDPLYNAVDDNVTFYAKTQECVSFNSQVTPPNDNALTIFWILLIIIGVCIILWLMLSSRGFGLGKMDVARSGED